MKVYVDELPKSCERCPFHDTKYGRCDISGARVDYFGCHSLAPLSDHDKQVRKQVCEEIAKKMENKLVRMQPDGEFGTRLAIDWYDINKVLDQIQGETNDNKRNH